MRNPFLIASYPRSGNTFFHILLHKLCGFRTHSVYPIPSPEGVSEEDIAPVVDIIGEETGDADLAALAASSRPEFRHAIFPRRTAPSDRAYS